jgi:aryl-alcohol dehydrogenase-like predicted oxidoreductase
VADFQKFVDAGITTFDTGPEECGYGPSELIIGEYLKQAGEKAQNVQVFTKVNPPILTRGLLQASIRPLIVRSVVTVRGRLQLCCVGQEMNNLPPNFVKSRMDRARARLGVDCLDLVQFYWNDYG